LPERRSGFDRRLSHPLLGQLRDSPATLAVVVASFVAMSLIDLQLTTYELQSGLAVEGNPVMASLFAVHPSAAGAFKLGMTAFVAAGLWAGRRYRGVLAVSVIAFIAYAALVVYHFIGISASGAL
jgi:hypothetical protein